MTDKTKSKKVKKVAKTKDTTSLVEKIAALEAQILYGQAEKTRKYAIEAFSQEILLVKDSLDAALAIKKATVESYKDGVEWTVKQLATIFEKFNIEELDPTGEAFDPNVHQAMTMLDSDEEPNKILTVFQKGYKLNGRVLRPALVSVSKEKEKKAWNLSEYPYLKRYRI